MTITDEITSYATRAVRAASDSQARLENALRAVRRTDSPIEAIFAATFVAARDRMLADGSLRFAVQLEPQAWVTAGGRNYRLDFAIVAMDPWLRGALAAAHLELKVGIELDGHAFHERTPEQVTARNRRDRDLAALKWRVLHFSGSELHHNPMVAVVEALQAGADALDLAKMALVRA